MFGFGLGEMVIVLLIVVVLFGVGRIGDLGGDLGRAIRNFRKALNEPDAIDVTPRKDDAKKEEATKEEAERK